MDKLPRCPHCYSDKRQTKAGRTKYHSARFHCVACDKDYTSRPKQPGYDTPTRKQAVALHLEGLWLRAVACVLNVNPQSVANWVSAYPGALEDKGETSLPPAPLSAETVELDEVHVLVGARKGEKNAGSTSRRRWTGSRAAWWAGPWLRNVPSTPCNRW
jgi:transposase-like protein